MSAETEAAVMLEVLAALEPIPPDDRLGFLFGLTVGLLRKQGFDDAGIQSELQRAIDLAMTIQRFDVK